MDFSTSSNSGQSNAMISYVSGARPTGDWQSAFMRWSQARIYYPEAAVAQGDEGTAAVELEILADGTVRSVRLINTSRSPFLDGGAIDMYRRQTVPAFTPDMAAQEKSTIIRVNLTYHIIRH
ncbi:energy transducer TonB [Acidisphaera sp. L21]|uniref:energy transducer TonB n=1 Tax=Acidisphaera sp. L21 TaxID=1641851 RepID=UPI00131E682E|nr:energy transducer TonB [Acidisphaera sp. L21]